MTAFEDFLVRRIRRHRCSICGEPIIENRRYIVRGRYYHVVCWENRGDPK